LFKVAPINGVILKPKQNSGQGNRAGLFYGLFAMGDKPIGDQSVKEMTAGCRKTPTKMDMAIGANSNTPGVSGKPGEFNRLGPNGCASPCVAETGDLKNDTLRVGKDVCVRTIDGLAFGRGGDHMQALPADDGIFGCRRSLVLR